MILIFEITAILILLVCLLYVIKYILLLLAKSNADKAFYDLFAALPKLYDGIYDLFSNLYALSPENILLVEKTQSLMSQALNFSIKQDGNERIIAYINSIIQNTEIVANIVSQDENININMQKYMQSIADFNNVKMHYNDSVQKLKHYADVFPTSLFARLKKIKTMDFLN